VDPVKERHAVIGHALSRVAAALEGKEISYVPDEQNPGQVRQVVTPRKSGAFFRDILLGAIAGGSAGAQLPVGSGAVGGFATGAQAGLKSLDTEQTRRKDQAQQSADEFKRDEDRKHQQAQIAHDTISNLHFDSRADLFNPTQVSSYNSSQANVKQLALSNGGTVPKIIVGGKDINGQIDNGGPLMDMFTKNPMSVMGAADGFHRIHFATVDTSGLRYKPGVGYVDAQGQHVDLADRTTHQLIDLPEAAWNKNLTLAARQINAVAGTPVVDSSKPDRQMSSTFGSIFGLGLKSKQELIQAHRDLYSGPKDENEAAQMQSEIDALKTQEHISPEEQQRIVVKQAAVDAFNKAKEIQEATKAGLKPPTPEEDKQKTRELEKKLAAGTLTNDERTDLIARQQEAKTQGLGSEIISQIGKPPVPAQFPKGANDPAFKKADAAWGAQAQKKKTQESTAAANIRVEGMAATRELPVMDTQNNNALQYLSAQDINTANKTQPGRYVPASQGMAAMKPIALLQDVRGNIDQTRQALNGLKNEFDAKTKARIAFALRSGDPAKSFDTLMTNLDIGSMPDDQQTYIQALASLAENAMSLRGVTGGGNAEDARSAIRAMLPSGNTPTRAYGLKQLDLLEKTVDRLRRGQPTVPLTGGAPGGRPENGQKQNQTQTANLPAIQPGFVRFKDSRGGIHDIPQQNLKAAQQRDPQLQVIQ